MKNILFLVCILCYFVNPCMAMSDEEYDHMLATDAKFALGEQYLSYMWQLALRENTEKGKKQALLAEQRAWVQEGRDRNVQACLKENPSRAQCYRGETEDRLEQLHSRWLTRRASEGEIFRHAHSGTQAQVILEDGVPALQFTLKEHNNTVSYTLHTSGPGMAFLKVLHDDSGIEYIVYFTGVGLFVAPIEKGQKSRVPFGIYIQ